MTHLFWTKKDRTTIFGFVLLIFATVFLSGQGEKSVSPNLQTPGLLTAEESFYPAAGEDALHFGGEDVFRAGAEDVWSFSLNPNDAPWFELANLPGLGPTLARRVVEFRETNGPFQSADQLRQIRGIGAKKIAKIRPFLRFD